MNIFNQPQTSSEFPVQNVPGMPMMPPHMYPGMIPPSMSGQPSGPRRNNNGNQIFPGPVPQEYVNMQRMGVVPPPILGFPPQQTPIRPPKSSELFDPNNPNNPNNPHNLHNPHNPPK